ncbi:MAG: hypothetical protein D6730_08305 [Bacteroidetes bacterium]|nr:MAG: hypothetical protein D6730_08305 [Bacteroidota bacterium]
MTPLEFKKKYECIRVKDPHHPGRVYTIQVTKYRRLHSKNPASKVNLQEWRTLREATRAGRELQIYRTAIAHAFHGKAPPRECRMALEMALKYQRASAQSLQTYSNKNLGLDCSGFVNQYFLHTSKITKEQSIWTYFSRGKKQKRENLSEISNLDVIIWTDKNGVPHKKPAKTPHIAVVQQVQPTQNNQLNVVIVESTGRLGLRHANCTFYPSSKTAVFELQRPQKRNAFVRVVPVV